MRVQETEASRKLQYHKVRDSDNGADLFTRALDQDSIVRHIEAMGCELMFRRDPIAFSVNNLRAKVGMEKSAFGSGEQFEFKPSGRMDAWTRKDLHSKTFKTKNKVGPT